MEDLEYIVRDIWSSFISSDDDLIPLMPANDPDLRASVEFRGDCTGAVIVGCSPAAGIEVARRMLRLPEGASVDPRDVADALGELANTVGGSVKGMLPGTNQLSLPLFMPEQRHAPDSVRIEFSWLGEHVSAEVWACETS